MGLRVRERGTGALAVAPVLVSELCQRSRQTQKKAKVREPQVFLELHWSGLRAAGDGQPLKLRLSLSKIKYSGSLVTLTAHPSS